MNLRPYRAEDQSDCLAIFDSNVPKYFSPQERPLFEAFLAALPGPYLVIADDEGLIQGCGGFAVTAGEGSMCWGMIGKPWHGRGLGTRLLQARIEQLQADPAVHSIRLDTSQHTRAFYERLGFQQTGFKEHGYAPDLHRIDMTLRWRRD